MTPCLASRKHTPKVAITTLAVGVLSNIYNYDYGIVLFNPTLTFGEQTFRLDKEGAAAYFIGGNRKLSKRRWICAEAMGWLSIRKRW